MPHNHIFFPYIDIFKFNIKKLEKFLTSKLGININLKLIKLNSPYFNSEILSQYIALNLKKYSIYKIWRKLKKIIRFFNYNFNDNRFLDKKSNNISKPIQFNYMKIKELYLCKNIISNISGIKLIIKGRLMKRKNASRSKKFVFTKGVFHFNSLASLIDYKYSNILNKGIGEYSPNTKLKKNRVSKSRLIPKNGSIGIKIFISNNVIYK